MSRNRNWAEKVLDQQRRSVNLESSDTRRVNRFVDSLVVPTLLDPDDFVDQEAFIRNKLKLSALMTLWAEFARDLERELNQSVPKEWAEPAASCTICGRPTALGQCLRADCGEPFANGPDTKF
jgi:hypothetical protein